MRNLIQRPNTVRYNLINDVDSLFNDRFFSIPLRELAEKAHSPFDEGEKEYSIALHMPGLKKEAVTISVAEEALKVVAQSAEDAPFKVDYNTSYALPEDVDLDAISAKLEDGILSLTVPKKEVEEIPDRVIKIS